MVVLGETWGGKSWYTTTKELQLASLELCIACRNYQTVHLNVDAHIPRRLLAAADAPPPHPKRLCGTRVPRLRARRVTWNMQTAAELRNPIFAMTDVDWLEFSGIFEGSLEAVEWPQRLKTIKFCETSPFNQPIDLVKWPASLQDLDFGKRFNQPIEGVCWPSSLRVLYLGSRFNQPIAGAILPATLLLLAFGQDFDHPIEEVLWPATLDQLIFEIGSLFNHPIEDVAWPPSLRYLTFGQFFNQPVARVKFPASLQQLCFGWYFNQPVEGTVWPNSLQRLVLGRWFNQPVDNVRWAASLEEICFGWYENRGDNRMVMYSKFNHRIGSSIWPPSLRRLTLGHKFRQSLQGLGTWMPNLETLCLLDYDSGDDSLLRGIKWPKGLRELTVFRDSDLEGVEIPSTVGVLHVDNVSFR
ncbi:unnamed protein product [Ectocarpus sp. 8 AP-2014]